MIGFSSTGRGFSSSIYIYIHTYIYIYIHTYIYTYTHTHTHTHIVIALFDDAFQVSDHTAGDSTLVLAECATRLVYSMVTFDCLNLCALKFYRSCVDLRYTSLYQTGVV